MQSGVATIRISLEQQLLRLTLPNGATRHWSVSTAANGAGEQNGSLCTPRGRHVVRAKIGAHCPPCAVFVGRRFNGEIYTPELGRQYPKRDWILTRILWLSGCEPGFNRLGQVDTMRRYIYIHGTPADQPMGIAASHGCIRMRQADLLALFDAVDVGCRVDIVE